jgi:hypothetical protein
MCNPCQERRTHLHRLRDGRRLTASFGLERLWFWSAILQHFAVVPSVSPARSIATACRQRFSCVLRD